MEIQEILDYIGKTPANTNPNVLGTMLQELGGGGEPETITVNYSVDDIEYEVNWYYTDGTATPKSIELTGATSGSFTPQKNSCMIIEYVPGANQEISGETPLFTLYDGYGDIYCDLVFCDADMTLHLK